MTAFHESATLRRGWRERRPRGDALALSARLHRPGAGLADLCRINAFVLSLGRVTSLLRDYDGPTHCRADLGIYADGMEAVAAELRGFTELFDSNVDTSNRKSPWRWNVVGSRPVSQLHTYRHRHTSYRCRRASYSR